MSVFLDHEGFRERIDVNERGRTRNRDRVGLIDSKIDELYILICWRGGLT